MEEKVSKPRNMDEYYTWLTDMHKISAIEVVKQRNLYFRTSSELLEQFARSELYVAMTSNLKSFNDEYSKLDGYQLLKAEEITLVVKPWKSFIEKTYRKNVLENENWPKEPKDGWILPRNWFVRVKDIVRTLVVVKYLDGATFLTDKFISEAERRRVDIDVSYEARDHGYYAIHINIPIKIGESNKNLNSVSLTMNVEIQISTELQDAIRQLTHVVYEERRMQIGKEKKIGWQWNYGGDEFVPNYLGHILHYVEGMIMDVRNKQKVK